MKKSMLQQAEELSFELFTTLSNYIKLNTEKSATNELIMTSLPMFLSGIFKIGSNLSTKHQQEAISIISSIAIEFLEFSKDTKC